MGETQRLNTGRSSEFADSAGGSNSLTLTFTEINYTGGVQGFGAIADVTGVTISFNLAVAGLVQFFGSGASLANPFIQGNYLGLAVNVNGTDYMLNGTGEQGFNGVGGGNLVVSGFTSGDAISGQRALSLAAGSYTVKLRAFGNGYLESSVNFPTRLTAVYPTMTGSITPASPLTSQESFVAGPHNLNGGDPLTVVPGTTISVTVSAPQTVIVMAYGEFDDPGNNRDDGTIGVRVTKPGPTVVDLLGSSLSGNGNDVNATTCVCNRAISIPAGTSTFAVYHQPTGVATRLANIQLTVVYTVPQAVQAAPFAHYQTAVRTAGDDTSFAGVGVFNDVAGPVEVTANTTGGDVIVEVQGAGETEGGGAGKIGLGLKVDGVEQATSPGFTPMGQSGTDSSTGSVGYKYLVTGLSAGSHTFRLTKVRTGTANNTIYATTGKPLRMFVWYN